MRALHPALHGGAVIDHLVHRHRQCGVVSLHDHAQGIADEQHVGPGAVEKAGETGIVGREHGDPLAGLLHLAERIDGDLLQGSPPFRVLAPRRCASSWWPTLNRLSSGQPDSGQTRTAQSIASCPGSASPYWNLLSPTLRRVPSTRERLSIASDVDTGLSNARAER